MAEPLDKLHTACVMIAEPSNPLAETDRLYSVCFYGRGWIVPEMQFLEAATDDEADALAGSMRPWMTREIWDRHRLVRVLPPTISDTHRH